MPVAIANLDAAAPASKTFEGYFRFLCPSCGELRATVNPRNNLAHCFCCKRNNNIDLLLELGYDFPTGIPLLQQWLIRYQALHSQKKNRTPPIRRR